MADIPFIGRNEKLKCIDGLVMQKKSYLVFIHGDGGIGKTRLLREIRNNYLNNKDLCITNIIDFDDRKFHNIDNVGEKIFQMIGDKDEFQEYLIELNNYRDKQDKVEGSELRELIRKGNESFIKCFNSYTSTRRVLLFFDTIETLANIDFWHHLVEIGFQLSNCLIFIAGRDAKDRYEKFLHKDRTIKCFSLTAFNENESRTYLYYKQKSKSIKLDDKTITKLISLSGGLPIFLDLSVEWLSREIPFELLTKNYDEIKFEKELVIYIAQRRNVIDDLILLMAHVYPLDPARISNFLDISIDEGKQLFGMAKNYVFVKCLSEKNIVLHDEMRRLINEYVWKEIDPENNLRRRYSEIVIDCVGRKINSKNEEAKRLDKNEYRRLHIEQKLIKLQAESLRHKLYLDIEDGIKYFEEIFDSPIQKRSLQQALCSEMAIYEKKFSPDQLFRFNIKRVIHLRETGYYSNAYEIILYMLNDSDLLPERRISVLIEKGNIETRLGKTLEAVDTIRKSKKLCRDKKDLMRTSNALGWVYRNIENYTAAIKEYEEARSYSIDLHDKFQEAIILNNLAVAHAKNSNFFIALEFAEEAKEIWKRIQTENQYMEEIGSNYHAYSEIYRLYDNFQESISYAEKALEIFQKIGNIDWVNRLTTALGSCLWELADSNRIRDERNDKIDKVLRDAEDYLRINIDSDSQHGIESLHYMGHIYLTRWHIYKNSEKDTNKYIEKAQFFFDRAYNKSKKLNSYAMQLNSLGDLIYIADQKKEYYLLEDFKQRYYNYKKQLKENQIYKTYPQEYEGIFLKYLGDFYLSHYIELSKESSDIAEKVVSNYYNGIILIGQSNYLMPYSYSLIFQLRNIEDRLDSSPKLRTIKIELGKKLNTLWNKRNNKKNKHELVKLHPAIHSYFIRWQQGESFND